MSKLFESDIEKLAIERLETLGYHYVYGPDINTMQTRDCFGFRKA